MSRSWTFTLAPGTQFVTANHRGHWGPRNSMTKQIDKDIDTRVKQHKIPPLERASVLVEYECPPRSIRERGYKSSPRVEDHDALAPVAKAIVDAFVTAGVLADDTVEHVVPTAPRIRPEIHPRGQLFVTISEVPGG